jgi:hypothetical protein
MDDIIEPTIDYDFSNLYLGPPSTLAGGAYFTRMMYNNNKLLYLQTPKCLTKQGFVKSGKKMFVDLMFDNNDTVFINWIENLETKCQELIHSKGEAWFQSKLEKDDIETAFTSPFKIYKSGKYYLLRVNVKPNIKIYNEADESIKIEDITTEKTIISILELQGIRFTSRNFQIEIELKQSMVVSPDPFLDECFIKKPVRRNPVPSNTVPSNTVPSNTVPSNTVTTSVIPFEKIVNSNTSNTNTSNTIDLDISDGDDEIVEEEVAEEQNGEGLAEEQDGLTSSSNLDDFINETANELTRNNQILSKGLEENTQINTTYQNSNANDNIVLEIEELDFIEKDDPNILKEVDLSSSLENSLESITLKKPNQVYYEIYKKAREKAKECKKVAIAAYLEAKNIKNTYMLEDNDESDSDESELDDFDKYENEDEE